MTTGLTKETGEEVVDVTESGDVESASTETGPANEPEARPADDHDPAVEVDGTTLSASRGWRSARGRVLLVGVLPGVLLLLALAAGGLKWIGWEQDTTDVARVESVRAASDGTVAMLSYRPDTVQNDLDAAEGRLTGAFRDSYSSLVDDVVAPAAIQKLIVATTKIAAASSVSASRSHAVVLLFVDQTTTVGNEAPSVTSSSVRVTLDKEDGRWLISNFEPI